MRALLIKIRTFWSSLGKEQKFGFWVLVVSLLVIPVSVGGALTIQRIRSRAAYPVTPPIPPTPTVRPTPTPSFLPDLVISGPITASPNPAKVGIPVLVSFKMSNVGLSPATPAQYNYTNQAGGFSKIHSSNTCSGSASLKPRESCTSAYLFTFSSSGTKTLTIKLDPNNLVKESNEKNNDYSVTLIVVTSPTPKPTPTVRPTPTPTHRVASPTPTYTSTSTPSPTRRPPVCRFYFFRRCWLWF